MNLTNFIPPEYVFTAFGWTLAHALWQGLVVALILKALLTFVKFSKSNLRYWLSVMAMLTMLVWPINTFVKELSQQQMLSMQNANVASELSASAQVLAAPMQLGLTTDAAQLSISQSLSNFLKTNSSWLALVWLVGVLFFTLRLQAGVFYIHRLRKNGLFKPLGYDWDKMVTSLSKRMSISRKISLYESIKVTSPIVVGHLKPIILIPVGVLTGLDANQVEAILAHELAHVKRHDYLINICQSFVEALFFFHPAAWWISGQIRSERENCCDDMAVAICQDKMIYAKTLTQLEEMLVLQPSLALGFAGHGGNSLLNRVRRLFLPDQAKANIRDRIIPVIVLGLLFMSLAFYAKSFKANMDQKTTVLRSSIFDMSSLGLETPSLDLFDITKISPTDTLKDAPEIILEESTDEEVIDEIIELLEEPVYSDLVAGIPVIEEIIAENIEPYLLLDFDDLAISDIVVVDSLEIDVNGLVSELLLLEEEQLEKLNETLNELANEKELFSKEQEQHIRKLSERLTQLSEEQLFEKKEALKRTLELNEVQLQRALRQSKLELEKHEDIIKSELKEGLFEKAEALRDAELALNEVMATYKHDLADLKETMSEHKKKLKELERLLRKELISDGFIQKSDDRVKIKMNDDSMKINGKKVDEKTRMKYRKLIKKTYEMEVTGTLEIVFD